MKALRNSYDEGLRQLIMPKKETYEEELIGAKIFPAGIGYVHRKNFSIKNEDGFELKGYMCLPQSFVEAPTVPCIMYLHAHGGSSIDSLAMRHYFLPKMAVCTFDFAGCGLSEGEYISLGPKEKRDTLLVVNYLRTHFKVGQLFIWGRSMGAVAAIMLASEHPEVAMALVLDSPFSDLTKMVKDVVTSERNVPRCLIGCVLGCLAKSAKKKCGQDIRDIVPLNMVHRLSLPVFFMVAKQDLLARPWRVKALFEACGSHDKSFFLVEGDHCTQRDSLTLRKAANFIFKRWVLDNYRRNPDTSQLEGGNVLTEDDRETLKQKSTSIELHNLGTSNLSSILAQAHQEYKESNPHSPQHLVLGQVTVDWPSVTILKRDFTRKPDVELLQSGVQPFDELQREITDIKEKKEVRKIIRRPLNVCINARPEE